MDSTFEIEELGPRSFVAQGVHSTVYRARARIIQENDADEAVSAAEENGSSHSASDKDDWVAIKIVSALSRKVPHDIHKEARLLLELSHSNIVKAWLLAYDAPLEQYELFMPLMPINLSTILDSPYFIPQSPSQLGVPRNLLPTDPNAPFEIISRSIIFQLILGLAHLHNLEVPIAHRDIKPANVVITRTGCVKLIDFGVAWIPSTSVVDLDEAESEEDDVGQSTKETEENMYFQVGSGAFRAPELFFTPQRYNAKATDLWSLGATLASFFTSIRFFNEDADDHSWRDPPDADEEPPMSKPFIFRTTDADGLWRRVSLFDSHRGDLGLVVSIFRLRGTPDENTWPSFKDLPGAQQLQFKIFTRVKLETLLPNLPQPLTSSPLDLIDRLLAYEPSSRLNADAALSHPWFQSNGALVLPNDHSGPEYGESSVQVSGLSWERRDLTRILECWVQSVPMEGGDDDDETYSQMIHELNEGVRGVIVS